MTGMMKIYLYLDSHSLDFYHRFHSILTLTNPAAGKVLIYTRIWLKVQSHPPKSLLTEKLASIINIDSINPNPDKPVGVQRKSRLTGNQKRRNHHESRGLSHMSKMSNLPEIKVVDMMSLCALRPNG